MFRLSSNSYNQIKDFACTWFKVCLFDVHNSMYTSVYTDVHRVTHWCTLSYALMYIELCTSNKHNALNQVHAKSLIWLYIHLVYITELVNNPDMTCTTFHWLKLIMPCIGWKWLSYNTSFIWKGWNFYYEYLARVQLKISYHESAWLVHGLNQ